MLKELRSALIAIVLMTVVFGGLYPLVVTGISQPVFGRKADGDTRLLGVKDPSRRNFLPRPSPTGYSTTASAFSNAGPNNAATRDAIEHNMRVYATREAIPLAEVPATEGQTSASGVDPDITPGDARIQARRVAHARGLPLQRVLAVVDREQRGRGLGFIGQPHVNVNDLNAAVDEVAR